MKRALPVLIVSVVGLATIAAGAILYRGYHAQMLTMSKEQAERSRREEVHAIGSAKARVTIEEFGDFQCPPCGQLAEPLNQIERESNNQCRLVFREFPLINHAHAKPAAYAAEAAGLQGRFWEMHDILYREQSTWSKAEDIAELFTGYAKVVGLDLTRFQKDLAGEEVKMRVSADQERAAELGVTVTPSVFVNGKTVSGPLLNPEGLRAAIKSALSSSPSP